MSIAAPSAAPAPFEVYSVHFQFQGGQAIKLVDPAANQPNPHQPVTIGAMPEWVRGARNELAAYVRGTRLDVRVGFRGTPADDGTYRVGADGTPFQVEERSVTLAFDPASGLSAPQVFREERPARPDRRPPGQAGLVRQAPARPVSLPVGRNLDAHRRDHLASLRAARCGGGRLARLGLCSAYEVDE